MKQYAGYLIDLDGTAYKGIEVIPEAIEFVKRIEKRGCVIYLLRTILPKLRPKLLAI